MISGMERYLNRAREELKPRRQPAAGKLRLILGVADPRQPIKNILPGKTLAETPRFTVREARWPVLEGVTAEGIHLTPKGKIAGCVVAVPDADQPPERLTEAQAFAAAGYEVLAPVLIDTGSEFSGNPEIRMSQLPHREWIYRMAFPVGRHPAGYEVQKVLAAVDWFASRNCRTSIYGRGEGGRIAQFGAALDERIAAVDIEDASIEPQSLAEQPVYRNVFGLLRDFGDAEIRQLLGSRMVKLERSNSADIALTAADASGRMRRQVKELEEFTQRLVRASRRFRDNLWKPVTGSAGTWRRAAEPLVNQFTNEVIGRLPSEPMRSSIRSWESYKSEKWRGWEVQFDVRPEFFGYGVLLVPRNIPPGQRRPLVVVQHGLDGRPQHMFQQKEGRPLEVYRNFGEQLADLSYVVYLPQNPYVGSFRHLAKMANPLGLSLYSLIGAQYSTMLDWLVTLPFVDADRIGFYGLSYGGKTALRIPPFEPRYKVVICGGDFNEWIGKLTTPDEPWSYVYTREYEILEWNMAHVASHAELAMLIAPRHFMVERGHRDGVGIDEWVASEYARVRRFYDEKGIGDRTRIAYFNGPHRVDGPDAIAFLESVLGAPAP
jgi:cephalosporin-C deacetylase-like acetyl esterase